MGFNYRKSINLGKGIRLNISKSGPSISLGRKGMRVTVNSKGTARGSVGIPGSGIYYNKQLNLAGLIKSWFGAKEEEAEPAKAAASAKQPRPAKAVAPPPPDLDHFREIHRFSDETVDWQEVLASQDEASEEGRYTKALAQGVLKGDDESWLKVIEEMEPFNDLLEYGSDFEVGITVEGLLGVTFNVHSDTVVPEQVTTILKSGRESVKPMGVTKRNALIRDYIVSAAFRVARDLFALLPAETIVINAEESRVNPATGHPEEMTLLSVIFPRETFVGLNFQGIVPTEALSNFEHAMDFKVTKGLMPVLPLK